jgi:hypothetical protein
MRSLMTALVAALIVALGSGAAVGRSRIELSPFGAIRATSSRLTLAEGEIFRIICDVTLGGNYERLINKVRGAQIGTFESDAAANCTNSLGRGTTTLNYLTEREEARTDYNSIAGTLPNIASLLVLFTYGFLIRIRDTLLGEMACLFRVTMGAGATANPIRSLVILNNQAVLVRQLSGNIECPRSIEHSGEIALNPGLRVVLLER